MTITRLYKKKYTIKQWNKFNIFMQQKLTNTYDVILLDHKTSRWVGGMAPIPLKERLRSIPNKITATNINRSIDAIQSGTEKLSKAISKLDGKDFKIFQGISEKDYAGIMSGSKRDYSSLTGSKNKKRDYSFLTSK